MILGSIYVLMVLLVGSVYDWKYFSLPVWLLAAGLLGGIGGALYSLLVDEASVLSVIIAFLPGAIALLLSYLTGEQIGYGDGLILLAMGGCMGIKQILMVAGIALGVSFAVSVTLVVLRRVGRTQKLPFVPFLLIGWMAAWGGGFLFG